ncbi:MAG: N-6 DNA methylase [Flavobacteriales bacterium]|nr:N-6 DNA methylase [Flavobacteriales bacterium]
MRAPVKENPESVSAQTLSTPSNFFSSGLRQKVDQLMDILWSGGVNNPATSIEQISYLLFLRMLTEEDEKLALLDKRHKRLFSGASSKYAWGNFVTLTGKGLFDAVRDAIEHLHELPSMTETGKLLFSRATLKIYDYPTLRAVVQTIHEMDLSEHHGIDLKGDMYEYLLGKIAASGTNGQFRTPRHIIDTIVTLVDPKPHERICDPAVGTAGFLVAAFQYILRQHSRKADVDRGIVDGSLLKPAQWKHLETDAYTGFDNDADMVKIGILNLYLHRLKQARVAHFNPLTTGFANGYPGQLWDVMLANPPFSGKVQAESILSDLNHKLDTRSTELLFLKWFIDHLAPEGRAGIVVPEGVVLGPDAASRKLRKTLLEENRLEAVIALPPFCFKPYASVATYALIFRKGGSTSRTWMYQVENDGFSDGSLRTPVDLNDLPDLLQKWGIRGSEEYQSEPSKHGWVSREQIIDGDLPLAPRLYLANKPSLHNYKTATLGELCSITKGTTPASSSTPGRYPLVTTAEDLRSSPSYQFEDDCICIPLVSSTGHGHASIKRITYMNGRFAAASIIAVLQIKDRSKLLPKFLHIYLEANKDTLLVPLMKGAANVSLGVRAISSVVVPIPTLAEQQELINEVENYDYEIAQLKNSLAEKNAQREQALRSFAKQFSD